MATLSNKDSIEAHQDDDQEREVTSKHKKQTAQNGHSRSEHDSTRSKTTSKFLYNTLVCEYQYCWS